MTSDLVAIEYLPHGGSNEVRELSVNLVQLGAREFMPLALSAPDCGIDLPIYRRL